jgi:hypothetical protein
LCSQCCWLPLCAWPDKQLSWRFAVSWCACKRYLWVKTLFFFFAQGTPHFLALAPIAWPSSLFRGAEVLVWTGGTGGTGNSVASLPAFSFTKTCPEDLFFSWSSSGTAASGVIH